MLHIIPRTFLSRILIFSCCGLICAIVSNPLLTAQNRYEWKVLSALNAGQTVAIDTADRAWLGTTGGIVHFDKQGITYEVIRTTEGLVSLEIHAIAFNPANGDMYAGGSDGSINIRKTSGEWKYSMDISSATEYTSRKVNGFGFRNDKVFILTDFGVAVFNPADSTLSDAYVRLGTLPQATTVNDILFFNGKIWLATNRGVVCASENATNLASPDAWTVYNGTKGLTTEQSLSFAIINGRITVGTSSGAFDLQSNDTFKIRTDLPATQIRFSSNGQYIVASVLNDIYRYTSGSGFSTVTTSGDEIFGIAVASDGSVFTALKKNGIALMRNDKASIIDLNTPVSNQFANMTLASDSSLWVASARQLDGFGASRMRKGVWTRFTKENTGELKSQNVFQVSAGSNGVVWGSTWGSGVMQFIPTDTGVRSVRYDNKNSPFTGINGAPDYVLGGQGILDRDGRMWLINFDNSSNNGPLLVVRLREGEQSADGTGFDAFSNPLSTVFSRAFIPITIDLNNTKWMGTSFAQVSAGLVYMNDRGTFKDRTDDKWGVITMNDGLLVNDQTALVVDPDGELWIGSLRGIQVLVNPSSVVNDNQRPVFRVPRPVKDVPVKAIAVDALNRKWVGTESQGVYVLSSDGSEVLYRFTTSNSPLVNDHVLSIVTVDATGDVYIGTQNGLCVVSTDAVRSTSQQQLLVSPNPFVLPSADPLRIEGVPQNGNVKIMSITGTMIRQINAPGGAVAFWDGNDASGKPVTSGVYLIAAGDEMGQEVIMGKVAVIRK